MNENKKMEIVYVRPWNINPGKTYEWIKEFPVESVLVLGQNLDGAGFFELVNRFKGIFEDCEYRVYASSDMFSQDHIFPHPDPCSSSESLYPKLEKPDLRLQLVNPALLVDIDKRTLTYQGVTRINAHLDRGIGEHCTIHNGCISLEFVLEKEILRVEEDDLYIYGRIEEVGKMTKPSYFRAWSNTPWSTDQLLKVLHKDYGISAEVIDGYHEKARSAVISRLNIADLAKTK